MLGWPPGERLDQPPVPRVTATWYARACLGGALTSLVALPVLPVTALSRGPVLAINKDLGEQVDWP